MALYSVTISVICIVDDDEQVDRHLQDVQVHIVEANDFDDAKRQAVAIGRTEERNYLNDEGNKVYWRFKEIEYIRCLGEKPTGVEIATRLEWIDPHETYSADHDFKPEKSEPITDDVSDA
jgi:hypothetical protein